jgi:hypothetical protein|tara:strand:- start:256 stop:381 length:126 start_codon:yes stop_codon:yes gene_type:complete
MTREEADQKLLDCINEIKDAGFMATMHIKLIPIKQEGEKND